MAGVSILAGFNTRLDTPPSINRRHPDSDLALVSVVTLTTVMWLVKTGTLPLTLFR